MKYSKIAFSVALIFFFLFSTNSFWDDINDNNRIEEIKSSSGTIILDESSLTIPYGKNVQENREYEFSGAFYDTSDDEKTFGGSAYLETKLVADPDVYGNTSLVVDNMENVTCLNNSISIGYGIQHQNGTLGKLDGDYAMFNSSEHVESYWSWMDSFDSFEAGDPPSDWTVDENDEGKLVVLGEYDGRDNVLEIIGNTTATFDAYRNGGFNTTNVYEIEFYTQFNYSSVSDYMTWTVNNGTNTLFAIIFYYGTIYDADFNAIGSYSIDTWIDVMGFINKTSETYDIHVDDVLLDSGNPFKTDTTNAEGETLYGTFVSNNPPLGNYLDNIVIRHYPVVRTQRLNFNISTNIENTDYLLELYASAYYNTSICTNVSWSIYNFEDLEWTLINSTFGVSDGTPFKSWYKEQTFIYKYYDKNNDNKILFNFYAYNDSNYEFNLNLDLINVTIWRKLVLSTSKSFSLLGLWKYRFHILEDWFYSDWYYFDVILQEENVELISESSYLTEWQFLGSGYETEYLYQSDFRIDDWNAYDMSEDNLTFYFPTNYLLEEGHVFSHKDNVLEFIDNSLEGGSSSYGIYHAGSSLLVVHSTPHRVYEYDEDFNYVTYYSIPQTSTNARGIACNGTNYIIIEWYGGVGYNGLAYVYDLSFNYEYCVNLDSSTLPTYGCWNGTHFYITYASGTGSEIYVYNSSLGYETTVYVDENLIGICYHDSFFYAIEGYSIHKYDASFDLVDTYTINYDYDGNHGVDFNGTHFFSTHIGKGIRNRLEDFYSTGKVAQTSEHVYMQTNTTETITMQTNFTQNLNLLENDKIEIRFNKTTTSELNLSLLDSESLLKEHVLSSEGNQEMDEQVIVLNVDGNYTINALRFNGELDDGEYLMVFEIEFYRYEQTSLFYSFDVNPNGLRRVSLDSPVNFTYDIYEDDILKDSGWILTSDDLQTLVYERIDQEIVYITYQDANKDYLDFFDFTTYANYTRDGVNYTDSILYGNVLYVDVNTNMDFAIYDSFNTLIKNTTKSIQLHVNIELSVYHLKILNKATKNVSYSLSKGSVEKTGFMFPDEIVDLSIASGNYILNYTNNEDLISRIETFNLSDNKLITINTIYFDVYFSLFNFDGLGLNNDFFRFYINSERKDLGFNTLTQDTNDLEVLDYFNASLYNQDVNLRGFTEYNIFIEVYTLIINNNYTESILIKIERNEIEIEQIIPSQASISYRFLTNIKYEIKCYDLNNTLLDKKEIMLDSNNKIVSFGFYSTEVPIDPTPIVADVYVMFWITIIVFVFASVLLYLHYRLKRKVGNIPKRIVRRYDKKKEGINKGFYNERINIEGGQ